MRAIGSVGDMPAIGCVMRSWCRTGAIATSTPASSPTPRAQAPAASTTSGVSISPRGVADALHLAILDRDPRRGRLADDP